MPVEASITMTVLITGATGSVGGNVLAGVLEHGVPVRVTSRDPSRAVFPPDVEVAQADLRDPESIRAAVAGVERVFLYPRFREPDQLMAVLRESGVEHVVLLSASAAAVEKSDGAFDGGGGMRWVEQRIIASGLTYTFVRPDTFAANALFWRDSIRDSGSVALPYPESVQVPIHERDIADIAVLALTTDRLNNAAPVLTGPAPITLAGEVAAIGAAIGRDVAVLRQTEAEMRAFYAEHLPPHILDAILNALRDSVGTDPPVSPEYEKITGRPGRTFAQWAIDHADRYR
jgi:uncharacterized protein YbjT (DUF2867 family)